MELTTVFAALAGTVSDGLEIVILSVPTDIPLRSKAVRAMALAPLRRGMVIRHELLFNHSTGSDSRERPRWIRCTFTQPFPSSAANTVVSSMHYNPATVEGQEFIEIMNISPLHSIDLTGCGFTSGIDYAFPSGTILIPGARLMIAVAKFQNDTALSNGGERIALKAPGGAIIRDFVYDDVPPWPEAADGTGPSLVLIAPLTNPDHNNPANWRASTGVGGNPTADEVLHFSGDPTGDDDRDGWVNLLEYALGQNPQIVAANRLFTVPRIQNADDAAITGEVSTALTGWTLAEFISSTPATLTYGVPAGMIAERQVFFRAKVRQR